MKKNRDRKDFIKDFILGELRKNGFSVSDIARKTGRAKSTVHCCIHGLSSSAIIQKTIIEMIHCDPWMMFPPVEYVPPQDIQEAK